MIVLKYMLRKRSYPHFIGEELEAERPKEIKKLDQNHAVNL